MTVRLVGLGTELRGDDAAGLLVARQVRSLTGGRAPIDEVSDLDGLVQALLSDGEVIVVDALRSPGLEGEVVTLEPDQIAGTRAGSSHGLGLAEAVAIARALGGRASLHVCGIRGRDFTVGARVTPEVAQACRRLAVGIARLLAVPPCVEPAGTRAADRDGLLSRKPETGP